LSILQDAAVGGITPSEFTSLEAFGDELNTSGGITVPAYVQQLADDVIFGNSANATWNGGSPTATALGNLSGASTQTQAEELVGMWFLGTNLPSMSLSAIGYWNYNPTYQASTEPLYGPSGSPSYLDVNQGYLGDCYFLASLGEVALQDPQAIENMITNNGNGTDSVRFFVNGQADYVTVNEELPVFGGGTHWANGSTLEFANGKTDNWVALVEKAYAELNAQTNAPQGMQLHSASDSYQGTSVGNGNALRMVTDQSVAATYLSSSTPSSTLSSILSSVASNFSAGEEVILQTPAASNGNLVGDHLFMVTGVNAATDTLTLRNPWGSAYSGSLAMTFSESIQQLASDNTTLWVTSGKPAA
jgi:hypothetical protein